MKAYAKINLSLDVVGIYPNSYHELDMINCTLPLFDIIKIKYDRRKDDIVITSSNKELPLDKKNVVYQVVEKFKTIYKIKCGIYVKLNKKIPVGAGLGGGSSDAACVLKALNKHFNKKMTIQDMIRFITPISADGPYLVYGKLARVKGIGEIITPIDKRFKYPLFVIKIKSGCSTKQIFTAFNFYEAVHTDTDKAINGIKEDNYDLISKNLNNSLKKYAIDVNPEIKKCLDDLASCGFDVVNMSGSGSTCFAFSKDKEPYKKAKEFFNPNDYDICKVYKAR